MYTISMSVHVSFLFIYVHLYYRYTAVPSILYMAVSVITLYNVCMTIQYLIHQHESIPFA